MFLGAGLGSVSSGFLSDQYGRRPTLMAFATIQLVTGKNIQNCAIHIMMGQLILLIINLVN